MILQPSTVELTKVHYYEKDREGVNAPIPTISRAMFESAILNEKIIKKNIFGHKWVLKINESERVKKRPRWKVVVYVLVLSCIVIAVCFGIYFSIEPMLLEQSSSDTSNTTLQQPNSTSSANQNSSSSDLHPNVQLLPTTTTPLPISQSVVPTVSRLKPHRPKLKRIKTTTELHIPETTTEHEEEDYEDEEDEIGYHSSEADSREIETTTATTTTTATYNFRPQKPKLRRKWNICDQCRENNEICLKLLENEPPKCVLPVDRDDPTGCGGLCLINIQYCKRLDTEIGVHQCINTRTLLRCPPNNFNCGNRCIPKTKRCDGIFHCSNYSDEENCECNLETHFQCGNKTSCLIKKKRCDGRIDCWDKSDEKHCNRDCNSEELPCKNGQCIRLTQFCDGVFDCYDRSDEPWGCRK